MLVLPLSFVSAFFTNARNPRASTEHHFLLSGVAKPCHFQAAHLRAARMRSCGLVNAYLRTASWPVLQSHAQAPFQHQKIDLGPAARARQGLSQGIFCEVVGPPRQLFVCVHHLDSMIGAEPVAFDRIGSIPLRPVPA